MKIVIDARWIFPELSGIGLYTRELIRNLARVDTDNSYDLLFSDADVEAREKRETGFDQAPNFSVTRVKHGPFSPIGQLLLPPLLRRLRADVFHSPNYMIPFAAFPRRRRGRSACVITVHDLIPLLFPHYTPRALKTRFFPVFKWVMRQAALRADAIIAPSESTRQDLIEQLCSGRPESIAVVHQGVTAEYRPPAGKEGGDRPVILYVGRFDPYKNISNLIRAFARIRAEGLDADLRVVGSDDRRYPEARGLARELGVDEHARWDGYLDGDGLLRAYQQADLFVLPSRYEGFGLTVLEAMACGTPVVCGNRSSLPEVVGDAAVTIDPDDVDAIAAAIGAVLRSPGRAARLRAAGLDRAAGFTWRKTAEKTLDVYRSLANGAGG